MIQRAIDTEQISGAVTVVARSGHVAHFEAHGLMDIEANASMRKDTIFPIASMTKPVTGVAILMLVEEGKVRLSDPVSRFIPEFRETKVAMPRSNAAGEEDSIYTVPAKREVTVQDLITHTSGLVSGGAGKRGGVTRRAAQADRHRRGLDGRARSSPPRLPAGHAVGVQRPGRDRHVGAHRGDRLRAYVRRVPAAANLRAVADEGHNLQRAGREHAARRDAVPPHARRARTRPVPEWVATRTLHSGGGGLWSTAEDYLQFAQMLVNKGELNGTRLLGPRTVELMASNHVGDLYAKAGRTGGAPGKGFGLTVDVVLDAVEARNDHRSTGSFGWSGAFGTTFWVDPREELTAILLVQTPGGPLRADFQNAVMQAIVD